MDQYNIMNIHKNIKRPYWIAKNKNNIVIHYGIIKKEQIVTTKHTVTSFNDKKKFIDFLKLNGHKYTE